MESEALKGVNATRALLFSSGVPATLTHSLVPSETKDHDKGQRCLRNWGMGDEQERKCDLGTVHEAGHVDTT